MILYFGLSMIRAFTYKKIKCKKNESLAWCIDLLTIETVHEITEILKDKNWVLTFLFDLSMISRWLTDCRLYHCVDRSNVILIIRRWFENWDFIWHRLNLF